MKVRNTFVIFIVSGFWHGANWNFIIWGALNALYFLPLLLTNNNRKNLGDVAEGKLLPSFREFFAMLNTFTLTVFAWIFFRAEDLEHAISYIGGIFSKTLISIPSFPNGLNSYFIIILIVICMVVEWIGRKDKFAIEKILQNFNKYLRFFSYSIIIILIFLFYKDESNTFIYFQF